MDSEKKRESVLEKMLVDRVAEMGGLAWKFTSPGTVGVPDRIIIYKGHVAFVEMKAQKKGLRKMQEWRAKQLSNQGVEVHMINSVEAIDNFCKSLAERKEGPNGV